ncbi:MAG: ATP-binding protein [Eubacterium sp.]|nr:ATP-binding protein [Eubacterium sp.]
MSFVKIFVILLAAVRICLYMRCLSSCIGKCRASKKILTAAFAVLWIFEGFFMSISHIGPGIVMMDLFFLLAEIPFLTAVSFCFQGSAARRVLTAVLLPTLYWIGKWSIAAVLFGILAASRQYLIVTAVSVSLFFVFGMILEKAGKSRQERERELLEQEVRTYENQFCIIRQSQHNIRALKHDMKHHIKMLTDMVSGGENEAALKYLASMGAFMENSEEYVATGNEKIDSILNYMISKAKDAGIDVSWNIQIPERLEIPVFDINVILSNLFENAMNALAEVTEPSFHIMMKYGRGILCISTQNNCSGKEQAFGVSKGHGFGLKNIGRIAEKYHGSLTAAVRDGDFQANVLLYLDDADTE